MTTEGPKTGAFEVPITPEEIDDLLGGITSKEDDGSNSRLLEEVRKTLDDSLSGITLDHDIGSVEQEVVVTPEDIDKHPDLREIIERSIRNVDWVKNTLMLWGSSLFRAPDGQWFVSRAGRDKVLPLERILRALMEEYIKPAIRAKKAQGGPGEKPFANIADTLK